jgi:acyl carrier protein
VVATEPETSSAVELRQFLQKSLPDYMIPAAFIYLESLALTPSGEVDRRALPQPDAADLQASNRYVAPRTPLEQQIADIWCEIFKMEQISIHDNFFNLGGHSLLAISLVGAVEDTLQKTMPLAALYQVTTIADMAYFLEQGEIDALDETSDDLPPLSQEVLRSMLTVVAGRQGEKPRPDSLITSMRTSGSKPPLFFCANRLLELSSLVSYLSEEQPVYFLAVGIYALGKLPPEQRPETIQAIAARHVRDMLTIHPDGPYLLAGYCFGSVMAYEIAKQLQAKGKQVIFYGALDYEGIGRRYNHYLKEVEPLMVDVKKYLLSGSLIQFILKVKAILLKIKDNFTLKEPVLPINLEDICMQGYTGKVTLFVPTEQEIRYNQAFRQFLFPRKGWEEHAVDLVKLAGTHMSIVYGTGDEDNNNIVYSDHLTRCYDDVREAANKLQTKIDEALVAFAHTK